MQGAALLKIHHTTAKIMTGVRPDMSDLGVLLNAENSSEFLADFQIVINLVRPLIVGAEQDAKNGKPPLTFSSDFGLVGPLYYVCINCPTVAIRTAAMELLLRCPRREGMWDSAMVAQMIQQFWDLEAKHNEAQEMGEGLDEFGVPVPFNDHGSIHFTFFGRPADISITGVSNSTPHEVPPSQLGRSPPSGEIQSNLATGV